jgi:RHS repeat-associated protein
VIACIAPDGVTIAGQTSGYTNALYEFTAVITPTETPGPIAYTWLPQPESGQGTASAEYRWATSGIQTIALTAENCGGLVSDTHTVDIQAGEQYRIYLPLVLRGFGGIARSVASFTVEGPVLNLEGSVAKNRTPAATSSLAQNGTTVTETMIYYEYDFANRLLGMAKTVTVTTDVDVQVVTETVRFTYDGLGRRVSKQTGDDVTRYVYDGWQVIEERNGADVLLSTYVERLKMDGGGSHVVCYQIDATGSIRALADETGSVVERVDYGPFGAPLFSGGGSEGSVGNPYLFHGLRYDAESGFYLAGVRQYDPSTGHHAQRGEELLGNPYTFAGNNPVNIGPY